MNIIRETIEGHFDTKLEAKQWAYKMRNKGYSVSVPFNNPFAYSNEYPYECKAIKQVTG